MVKDRIRRQLLHLDLHLEVFVHKKKKEIAENITAGSGNLKTHNLKTSGSGVSPNPHQRTSRFRERPGSFPGSYSTCSKQRDHQRPYTHGLFDHHGYISKPNIFFLDNHGYQHDAWRGFGLIFYTRPLWLPPIGNGGSPYRPRHCLQVVLDWLLSAIGPVTNRACSIVYYTQLLLGYGHCCCYHF
jgi:hypothetical protein